ARAGGDGQKIQIRWRNPSVGQGAAEGFGAEPDRPTLEAGVDPVAVRLEDFFQTIEGEVPRPHRRVVEHAAREFLGGIFHDEIFREELGGWGRGAPRRGRRGPKREGREGVLGFIGGGWREGGRRKWGKGGFLSPLFHICKTRRSGGVNRGI